MKTQEENKYKNLALWRMILVLPVFCIGVSGYMAIESYSFLEAAYMVTITMSTIGFGLVRELSVPGKIFTICFIIFHVAVLGYVLSFVASQYLQKRIVSLLFPLSNTKSTEKMTNHIIVCGYGRNGQKACEELLKSGQKVVAIENQPSQKVLDLVNVLKLPLITGNAVEDEVLKKAGILGAKAILLTLPDDADNVFISLTARELNKNIQIVARASDESSVIKLQRAGANQVVMPDIIGGAHMAYLVTKAQATEPFPTGNFEKSLGLVLKEIEAISLKPNFQEMSIQAFLKLEKQNMRLLGIKTGNDYFDPKPELSSTFKVGMVYIFYGQEEDWISFEKNFLL